MGWDTGRESGWVVALRGSGRGVGEGGVDFSPPFFYLFSSWFSCFFFFFFFFWLFWEGEGVR